ncbi:MAG: hypothetical protein KDJ52_32340, partial [Anaerolineae bacterium]|nr:hypothetical protein [Anaerolineae bacterium]
MKKQVIPTIALLLILCALGWYIDNIAHQEITDAVRFVIYAASITILLVLLVGVLYLILIFRERLLLERADRKVSEREANVYYIVADEGQQVFIRDADQKATWRNAHLDSRVYANGQEIQPSTIEVNAWQMYTLRNRPQMIERVGMPLLPAQSQIDLLGALDSVQRCLIVGASDV